jgi:hypothetical protein
MDEQRLQQIAEIKRTSNIRHLLDRLKSLGNELDQLKIISTDEARKYMNFEGIMFEKGHQSIVNPSYGSQTIITALLSSKRRDNICLLTTGYDDVYLVCSVNLYLTHIDTMMSLNRDHIHLISINADWAIALLH